ncbi:MAG: S8 family peptidase [Thermonemataceae bacterium]|nr:S8 family peptidase [Thermonemataceae bacterium]
MNFKHCLIGLGIAFQAHAVIADPPKRLRYDLDQHKFVEDTAKKAPENWFNKDFATDKIRGVSTEKAYQTLLKGKKSTTIVVAVIDSGIDIEHEDLKSKIWKNEKEIAGNGKDDDNNGYIDDIHGWDFLGGKDGKDVTQDSYEVTRELARLRKKYENADESKLSEVEKKEYQYFLKVKQTYTEKSAEMKQYYPQYQMIYPMFKEAMKVAKKELQKEEITKEDIAKLKDTNPEVSQAKQLLGNLFSNPGFTEKAFDADYEYLRSAVEFGYNEDFNPRSIIGDDYNNLTEKGYGNSEVRGPDAQHGTHVAGIIGADRNNNKGVKGVADNVRIMVLRAVPDGDERDKDIANAIIYAADNGAKIINMSFGKSFSPQKSRVDEAVKYAEKKGVLLIHAAGNDAENIDEKDNFPTKKLLDGSTAKNWIEVGASSWGGNDNFVGSFSNYGKTTVDIFAPGVDIYNSVPDSKYENLSGTSMAAPVVSGVAALVLSYYPKLTAEQLKDILLKSAVKYGQEKVNMPGEGNKTVAFGELSVTGGIVNVVEALNMAAKVAK